MSVTPTEECNKCAVKTVPSMPLWEISGQCRHMHWPEETTHQSSAEYSQRRAPGWEGREGGQNEAEAAPWEGWPGEGVGHVFGT